MPSPTERADKVRAVIPAAKQIRQEGVMWARDLLPPGSQLVTPEDIQAGYRVLTPEQAETVKRAVEGCHVYSVMKKALNALAGVPDKECNCGDLEWTVKKYGRITHKEGCPARTDVWSQTNPFWDAGATKVEPTDDVNTPEGGDPEGYH